MIGDEHICALNEPRICEECHDRVKAEREEARTALREAIDCMLAGHGWAQHMERWSHIANAEAHGRAVARTVQPLVGNSESEEA